MTENYTMQEAVDLASEPDQTVLYKLARRTLWIAYCWNDHNFEAAHKEARRTAEECGINSFDDANDWLKKLPKAPSTEKVSQEPDPQLCRFYGVDSFPALVEAQEKHIVKLQKKVAATEKPQSLYPPRVREG